MAASMTRPRSSVTASVAARAAMASRAATITARQAKTAAMPTIKGITSPSVAVPETMGDKAAEMSNAWASTNSAVMVPSKAVRAMGTRAERA